MVREFLHPLATFVFIWPCVCSVYDREDGPLPGASYVSNKLRALSCSYLPRLSKDLQTHIYRVRELSQNMGVSSPLPLSPFLFPFIVIWSLLSTCWLWLVMFAACFKYVTQHLK